eukprot:6223222-Pyramimonas_sp.AAC.1
MLQCIAASHGSMASLSVLLHCKSTGGASLGWSMARSNWVAQSTVSRGVVAEFLSQASGVRGLRESAGVGKGNAM